MQQYVDNGLLTMERVLNLEEEFYNLSFADMQKYVQAGELTMDQVLASTVDRRITFMLGNLRELIDDGEVSITAALGGNAAE